jgi:hypothetical protein
MKTLAAALTDIALVLVLAHAVACTPADDAPAPSTALVR